ncbi:MAG: hypothetical protein JW808_10310 [Victivallales bacterium]|nr:hypothetical protein [Victivallales bacterium]
MKTVNFQGWKNCVELKSGKFKLIVTTEIGPRIIGVFLGGSDNLVYVDPDTAGKTDDPGDWRIYGGHRLWHSPEAKPRSYAPDNSKVQLKKTADGLCFSAGMEHSTGIEKSFSIKTLPAGKFAITHKLKNCSLWNVELAAWALTVMAPGGNAVIPLPQGDKKALLPNRYLTVWPYTDLSDKRLVWGSKAILMKQDIKAKIPCKIGLNCEDGWLAYANKGVVLKKSFQHMADAEYPDNGCSIEVYTNNAMLEIETLSPMFSLEPGAELSHIEIWEACGLEKCPQIAKLL